MTTMLERAARAAALANEDEGCFDPVSAYTPIARAVLMAVRDGSPGIFSAMERARPLWPSSQCDNQKEIAMSANYPRVRAMIDAILNGDA